MFSLNISKIIIKTQNITSFDSEVNILVLSFLSTFDEKKGPILYYYSAFVYFDTHHRLVFKNKKVQVLTLT